MFRAWEKLYAVLYGNELYFYKDAKHRNATLPSSTSDPQTSSAVQLPQTFHNEAPLNLAGCTVAPSDYAKRRNVISLKLPFGSEYLIQCADEVLLIL